MQNFKIKTLQMAHISKFNPLKISGNTYFSQI